jgi:putative ABC transport system permease protein
MTPREWFSRLRGSVRGTRTDRDLEDELRAHLELAADEERRRGKPEGSAMRAARLRVGGVAQAMEAQRDQRGLGWLEDLARDLRFACRTLRQAPGFTIVAVLTLALGIGANSAMFSVINAVLLRPLPFPSPERLVAVASVDLRAAVAAGTSGSASWPDFFDWRSGSRAFEHLSAYRETGFTLVGGGRALHVPGAVVTSDILSTLGVKPALGRDFRSDDERAGADVALISDSTWRSQFAAAPDVVGRAITLNARRFTIVGVMPPGFHFPVSVPASQIWITNAEDARVDNPGDTPMTTERGAHFIKAIGRLRATASVASAQAELDVIAADLARAHPDESGNRGVRIVPELDRLVGDARQSLLVLLAAVGCVLLIACVNLANLLLARGAGRGREMALRVALGASGQRIVRQLLTESFVLAAIGTACGLALAYGSIALLVRLAPVAVRGLDQVTIDGPVVAFTAVIGGVSALVFGLIPAFQTARPDHAIGAAATARATPGRGQRRLRAALVIAETAIGVVLLVGAGLLLRSFDRLLRTAPGFDPQHVVTATFRLPDSRYSYRKQITFYDEMLSELRALPGVERAAATAPLPLGGSRYSISFQQPGAARPSSERLSADFGMVSPGYFRTLHVPLVRGREFSEADSDAAPRVVVVNERFARQYFGDADPIGQRIKPGLATTETETPWREIVGVVGDIKHRTLSEESRPAYFVPYAQGLISPLYLVVRTTDATGIAADVRKALARKDPELALYDVKTMEEYVATSVATPRFQTLLLALFAAVGLALTAIGLYGVMAYGVAQRTREFGIRLALGARPGEVLTLVLRSGLALITAGLIAGVVAGAFATRLLRSALYGVDPLDPATFAGVAAMLVVVATVASYVPARRATRVDPIAALRSE